MLQNIMDKIIQRYIFLYILLIPIFRYYALPPNNDIYLLLAVLCTIYQFAKGCGNTFKRIHVASFMFIVWLAMSSMIGHYLSEYSSYVIQTSKNNFIVFCLAYVGLVFQGATRQDYSYFIKTYKIICWVLIIFFLYQFGCTSLLHTTPIRPFDFLQRLQESEQTGVLSYVDYYRFSSVFSEPSHFAQYLSLLPPLYMYGYKDVIRKNIKLAIITTLPVLFCISGTGIVIMGVIWGYFLFKNIARFSIKQKIFTVIIGVIAVICISLSVGIMIMVDDMTDSANNKVLDRVSRGFYLFADLPIFHQIVGIGYQCVSASSKIYHMRYADVISNGHNEYLSDVTSILLTGGIIGFSYLAFLLKKIMSSQNELLKIISLAVIGIMSSEATIGALTMFYVCMVFATIDNNK